MSEKKENITNCLGCLPSEETKKDLGGSVWEGKYWRVSHCNGPFGEGTMVVEPKRHVARIEDLNKVEEAEMIPVFRDVSKAIREVTGAERVYMEHWTHTPVAHAHWLFIPVSQSLLSAYGDKKGPELISAMVARNEPLNRTKASELSRQIGERVSAYKAARDNREKEVWLALAQHLGGDRPGTS